MAEWTTVTSRKKTSRSSKLQHDAQAHINHRDLATEFLAALFKNSGYNGERNRDRADRLEYSCRACEATNWVDRTRCRFCGEARPKEFATFPAAVTVSRPDTGATTGRGQRNEEKGKGKGKGTAKGLHSGVRASGLAQPYAPPPWRPPRTDQAVSDPASEAPHATDGPPPAGTDGHLDAQIRTLERLRRAARDAGDQQYADLQSQRIAALRKTKAESRPIAARIESAERAHEQAIDSEQKAAQALAHAVEKHTKCQEHLRQTEH